MYKSIFRANAYTFKNKKKLKYCNKNVSNRKTKLIIHYSVKIVDNLAAGRIGNRYL